MLRTTRRSNDAWRKKDLVWFEVRDIYFPDPTSILHQLHDNYVLKGKVIGVSHDSRAEGDAFVAVRVAGLKQRCIVPAKWIIGGRPAVRR